MILQLHHQFKDGHTEMIEQSDSFAESGEGDKIHKWTEEAIKRAPKPPEKAQFMICTEESEFFVWTTTEEEMERVRKENKNGTG